MDAKEMAKQLRKPQGEVGVNIGNMMNKGNIFMYNLVLSHLNLKDNEKLLEIGFGNGKLIPDILSGRVNVQYEGIDYSDLMVNEAKDFNKDLIEKKIVNIRQGDFCSLPFEGNFFDKIITINTIYFIEDLKKGIKELFRVCKKDGVVLIGARPPETYNVLEFTKESFNFYEPEKIIEMLELAGFSDCGYEVKSDPVAKVQDREFQLKSMCIWGFKR